MSLYERLMGAPIATANEAQHKVGPLAGIPMLGLDALSSAAYGPEAALAILLGVGALGATLIVPITAVILGLLAIVYLSYRQTLAAYPGGGGSYTVAKENLGTRAGLIAAAALILDYVLNVAVGIAAGVGALISMIPALHPFILPLCIAILVLITLVNLHGVRESGAAFVAPTYLFVGGLGAILVLGLVKAALAGGHPAAITAAPAPGPIAAAGFWLILRAFANGCTAMTGVEAISNGISAFRAPAIVNAKRTLAAVIVTLMVLLGGIALLCRAYGIVAMDPDASAYQSVLSQLVGAVIGRGAFYYIVMGSVVAIVCLSANTSFADFPRICRMLALDNHLPYGMASRNHRLVNASGVLILAIVSGALLVAFGGVTDRLIPLFAIGAFAAFTLSQAGMVAHWRKQPEKTAGLRLSMSLNALGALSTGLVLVVVLVTKFADGAWVVLVLALLLYLLFVSVHRHYREVARQTDCSLPLDVSGLQRPVAVVVIRRWSTITRNALRDAIGLAGDVIAVHVETDVEEGRHLSEKWPRLVEAPLIGTPYDPPRLDIVASPYRFFFEPLLDALTRIADDHPGRTIAVVVPELAGGGILDYLLHNQRSTALKAALLLRGNGRIVLVNVPWYMHRRQRS